MKFNIALDGPSGAGKSSIAKQLAKKYNLVHLDTGAMYRAIAYFFKNYKKDMDITNALSKIKLSMEDNKVYLNEEDITNKIRNDEIASLATKYAKLEEIRTFLIAQQQKIASQKGYILDGRDIGSVVLPNAEIKFFLSADPKVRAERRYLEYKAKGMEVDFEKIYQDLVARDYENATRKHSPLIQVEDAYLLDSSNKTIDEVVEEASNYIESKVK